MDTHPPLPTFDPESIRTILFSYWGPRDDIAFFHINERRAALTEEGDHGIHLREADGNVVGMELHDFSRAFPRSEALSRVARPAIAELAAFAGRPLDEELDISAAAEQLPLTTHMLCFVIAHTLGALEVELREARARPAPALATPS